MIAPLPADEWVRKEFRLRKSGDISSVFASLNGQAVAELPKKYAELKKKLIKTDPEVLTASWKRLKTSLAEGINEIEDKGSNVVPSIDFEELKSLPESKRTEILKRGCLVVRGIIPAEEARQLKFETEQYVSDNPQTKGFPMDSKVVFELYWSKAQIKGRAHPNMRETLNFVNNLWHAAPDAQVSLDHNLSYADRVRIRNPGDDMFSLGPHADGGSLERWEDENYIKCYDAVVKGKWEEYDPFDATYRVKANMDIFDSQGNCTVFRSFQGWLSMSTVAPGEGTIRFGPLVKDVTAYYILRPFFNDDDTLNFDSSFPGSLPGKGQEFSDETHPHLELSRLMISAPKVNPGDAVFWHGDLIHSVDPVHKGKFDSSVLYIPAVPLCGMNAEYVNAQKKTFVEGTVAPDFPGYGYDVGESEHVGRATVEDVRTFGGDQALKEFGFMAIPIEDSHTEGQRSAIRIANQIFEITS